MILDHVRLRCHEVLYSFFFQAEDGIRDLVRSRGLGDVYKRQAQKGAAVMKATVIGRPKQIKKLESCVMVVLGLKRPPVMPCLLYTSDAADERSSVDLGGRRIIKKKNKTDLCRTT